MSSRWVVKATRHLKAVGLTVVIGAVTYGTYKLGKGLRKIMDGSDRKLNQEMEDYLYAKQLKAERHRE